MLDAGHGLNTSGKRTPDNSMHEWQFNSAVAVNVANILKGYDVKTEFTHDPTGKIDISLQKRTDYANNKSADCFVSIHANAAGSGWSAAEGIETYVYTSKPQVAVKLANLVQKKLIEKTGRKNRGVKTADFHVLRETHMTAILCECGFMTNQTEATLLKSADYRLKVAQAIASGLVEFYNLKAKPQPIKPVTPVKSDTVYRVQVGAFSDRKNAERLAEELKGKGYQAFVK